MGVAIINSTLGLIFKDRSTATAELGSTLENLVIFRRGNEKSGDDQTFWKGAGASSITLNDFLDFVLQPFVAMLLIMEDLEITETEAEETRVLSRRYGLRFNFETDDGRVDEITLENAMFKVSFIPLHANS